LLKGAEQVRGVALAHSARPDQLRIALNLAKAGHKLARAEARSSVSLEESEVQLLLESLRYANDEVHWAARTNEDEHDGHRREAVMQAFPELVERGAWRSFGLSRELEALVARLAGALGS
jgi:hypothetical protein